MRGDWPSIGVVAVKVMLLKFQTLGESNVELAVGEDWRGQVSFSFQVSCCGERGTIGRPSSDSSMTMGNSFKGLAGRVSRDVPN